MAEVLPQRGPIFLEEVPRGYPQALKELGLVVAQSGKMGQKLINYAHIINYA